MIQQIVDLARNDGNPIGEAHNDAATNDGTLKGLDRNDNTLMGQARNMAAANGGTLKGLARNGGTSLLFSRFNGG